MKFFLAWAVAALIQASLADQGSDLFRDGDTVCFLGDSITHAGSFHSFVYDYYLTRFPNRAIRFVNAGVAGDTAGGSMVRLDEDVFSKHPSVVVLMFGMNDVNRGSYVTQPGPHLVQAQAQALEGYRKSMDVLAERILAQPSPPRLVFVTPSPFDQTVLSDRDNNHPGCNDGLEQCAKFVAERAHARRSVLVDFHGPMTTFNLERQKFDPKFTIIGPDRVHPGAPGHLMMAWLFLRAQGAPSLVSRVVVDATRARVVEAENAEVSDVATASGGIAFTIQEGSLPFPIAAAARSLTETLPVERDLNQETLSVRGLPAGRYDLRIDEVSVGSFEKDALEGGVNLAQLPDTPQLAQSRRVAAANEARRAEEVLLRNYAAVRWFLKHRQVDPDDAQAVRFFAETKMSKTGYFESQVPSYLANWPTRGKIEDRLRTIEGDLAALRKPAAHRYKVVAVH